MAAKEMERERHTFIPVVADGRIIHEAHPTQILLDE
jgi:hypothetical protein